MAEFKPINTQEEFDAAIAPRITRAQETERKKFEGWLSPEAVAQQNKDLLTQEQAAEKYKDYLSPDKAAEMNAKIKGYETNSVKMRIAHEMGIPFELVGRLTGEDEAAIREDAEMLAAFLNKTTPGAPLGSTEPSEGNSKDAPLRKMVQGLKGE